MLRFGRPQSPWGKYPVWGILRTPYGETMTLGSFAPSGLGLNAPETELSFFTIFKVTNGARLRDRRQYERVDNAANPGGLQAFV